MKQSLLKEYFDYDEKHGNLIWKKQQQRGIKIEIGSIAGWINERGYRYISFRGKDYKAHRLVWMYNYGQFPNEGIDHVNHVKDDNRIDNLRDVSQRENCMNKSIYLNNKSGHAGVSFRYKKWRARINVNKKEISLGVFNKKEDAVKARKEAEIKYGFHENHGGKNG